jgi:membrane protease YdiL (CAAX protease family)
MTMPKQKISPPAEMTASESKPSKPKTIQRVVQSRIESVQQKKAAAAQLEKSDYQNETKRPLVCLAFVFPLILAYEMGTLMLGRQAFRSGVDQWLTQLLNNIGFGQLVLLPVVTAGIMIIWHHRIDDHWRIRWPVLTGMVLETAGLGLMLFWAANAFHLISHSALVTAIPASTETISPDRWWPTTMAFIGSGIYEELFFRLILLVPAIYLATRMTNRKFGAATGIILVSLIFAALHYEVINPAGTAFEMSSFFFRFAASIVFCVLFLFRGFGIAVGTHVAFDVLTQL